MGRRSVMQSEPAYVVDRRRWASRLKDTQYHKSGWVVQSPVHSASQLLVPAHALARKRVYDGRRCGGREKPTGRIVRAAERQPHTVQKESNALLGGNTKGEEGFEEEIS